MAMKKQPHPQKIGRYPVTGLIGRGGMGVVYRALVPESGEVVALKILRPAEPLVELLGMEKLKDIFTYEARKMAELDHPNIVRVLDFDWLEGVPFFIMEYHCNNIGMMIGEQLIMEETTRVVSPGKVLDYGSQVLAGLRFIHEEGIIHRDIKPHNILLTDEDTARISDFGMSRQETEERIDSKGLKIGTPYYIAPEQNRNPGNADQRADLYSTAVMLYRMLTGELPGMKSFLLSRINPLYDRTWDDFFIRALEWNPDYRFQSAGEMAAALLHLELHWEKIKDRACGIETQEESDAANGSHRLRTSPVRVSGSTARQAFAVNAHWQPLHHIPNRFSEKNEETVLDRSTGLIWQKNDQGYPVNRKEADAVIAALNESRFGGLSTWRLPTVNELLTLEIDPRQPAGNCPQDNLQANRSWYWSCDRRSEKTSWYVNVRLGYTGWQENGCRYSVLAVASLAV
ncbi:MAG: protein kinase [Desulfobulbaceae bacterium]|nr:protein kinase [Desulfobulbaceae bacterium]